VPEAFNNDHAPAATRAWRAMICGDACGHVRVVVFRGRIDRRQGSGDELFGARDIGFAGGTGEQSVVTDAMSAKIAIAIVRNCP